MKFNKNILLFTGAYFIIRIFSFFFGPETPLQAQSILNTFVSEIILASAIYLIWKNRPWGWYIIALEIILGGAGGFLSVGSISLRTLLLILSISTFFTKKITGGQLYDLYLETKTISKILSLLFVVVLISVLRGIYFGHGMGAIFADTIPYFFFLYYYPLRELMKTEKFKNICFSAICAAIIGNAIFMAFTLAGFSWGVISLQQTYYHWFRDVALGKITDFHTEYYRLVINEHLLLAPVLLYFLNKIIREKVLTPANILYSALLLFILSVNLTRIYMLALAFGLLFFFTKAAWKRWLAYCAGVGLVFVLIFTYTHLLATRGTSPGWEFFGLRLQSIVQPQIEDSSLSRMLLLPKIWGKIMQHPVLGNGLGDAVAVYSPIFKKEISTPSFDWGYLELWDELGIIGITAWLILLGVIISTQKIYLKHSGEGAYVLSAIGSLMVINITSPALFHVLGIIILIYLSNVNKYARV